MIHNPVEIPAGMRVYSGRRRFVDKAPKALVDKLITDRLISKSESRQAKSKPVEKKQPVLSLSENEPIKDEKSGKK